MTKEKTDKDKEEAAKVRIFAFLVFAFGVMFSFILALNVQSDQITHKFKSPSFNGVGTSSHYLTIENQEFSRKLTIKEEIKALQDEIEREKENYIRSTTTYEY